jgi:thymidylate synthase
MYITVETLDDALMRVFARLLSSSAVKVSATRGDSSELVGALIKISRPRARLSRSTIKGTVFSCLGELLWYLSGSNSLPVIRYYIPKYVEESEDGKTIFGAYGPRLLNWKGASQIENVVKLLSAKPSSRRAVIQLFDASDLSAKHKEIPCTCTIQFLIRGAAKRKLHVSVTMRSNDAFKGLPHDVFAFTMLQEIIARRLGIELGSYTHYVGSLHLYDRDAFKARSFVEQGWQQRVEMPAMPAGNPMPALSLIGRAEARIRNGNDPPAQVSTLESYWQDLIRLLQIYRASIDKDHSKVRRIKKAMSSEMYLPYIVKRESLAALDVAAPAQPALF